MSLKLALFLVLISSSFFSVVFYTLSLFLSADTHTGNCHFLASLCCSGSQDCSFHLWGLKDYPISSSHLKIGEREWAAPLLLTARNIHPWIHNAQVVSHFLFLFFKSPVSFPFWRTFPTVTLGLSLISMKRVCMSLPVTHTQTVIACHYRRNEPAEMMIREEKLREYKENSE